MNLTEEFEKTKRRFMAAVAGDLVQMLPFVMHAAAVAFKEDLPCDWHAGSVFSQAERRYSARIYQPSSRVILPTHTKGNLLVSLYFADKEIDASWSNEGSPSDVLSFPYESDHVEIAKWVRDGFEAFLKESRANQVTEEEDPS